MLLGIMIIFDCLPFSWWAFLVKEYYSSIKSWGVDYYKMKVHELSPFLLSELWSYLNDEADRFNDSDAIYFKQLDNSQELALDCDFTNTIFVDNVDKNNLKIMNSAKEKFQKKYNIKNLEWDTKN